VPRKGNPAPLPLEGNRAGNHLELVNLEADRSKTDRREGQPRAGHPSWPN